MVLSLVCSAVLLAGSASDLSVLHLPPLNPGDAQLKSIPLLVRPSRRGHFYGNAVRRRSERGAPHLLFDQSTQAFQLRIPYVGAGVGPRLKMDAVGF